MHAFAECAGVQRQAELVTVRTCLFPMPLSLLEASLLAECMMTPWGMQSLKILSTEQMPFCTQAQDFEPKPSPHPEMIMEVPQ